MHLFIGGRGSEMHELRETRGKPGSRPRPAACWWWGAGVPSSAELGVLGGPRPDRKPGWQSSGRLRDRGSERYPGSGRGCALHQRGDFALPAESRRESLEKTCLKGSVIVLGGGCLENHFVPVESHGYLAKVGIFGDSWSHSGYRFWTCR